MRRRVFWSILLTTLLIFTVTVSTVMAAVYNEFAAERREEIKTEAFYVSEGYQKGGSLDYIKHIGTNGKNRITLISFDGSVIYDSYANETSMENHLGRPEVAKAIESGFGEATRDSDTLSEMTYYYAIRLSDGSILRIAAPLKSIIKIIDNTATYIMPIMLVIILIAIGVARLLTKRIVRPINEIDLEHPLQNKTYDEISPLMVRIDKQNRMLSDQMHELSSKQREFTEITDRMSEALVVFSSEKKVLSANKSARHLFSSIVSEGQTYIELCRDPAYLSAVERAFSGEKAREKFRINGRVYMISADPVGNKQNFAAVLFAADITDAEHAEQMRREFSANVSHELKTPLTSILGCTEIMQNGVAKPEDIPRFTNQIYSEAKRLLSLIEDIIKLSRLDEGELVNEFSSVDLYMLSENVISQLSPKAEREKIDLTLKGEHVCVNGIENTLHEMIYNLCDNAISYNRIGGSVCISITNENGHPVLSVSDTGIGIAPEHQARIFERFYRVDKSHSKNTGGTGLGLSIVKHAAIMHGAEIKLESTIGKGSKISIIF